MSELSDSKEGMPIITLTQFVLSAPNNKIGKR